MFGRESNENPNTEDVYGQPGSSSIASRLFNVVMSPFSFVGRALSLPFTSGANDDPRLKNFLLGLPAILFCAVTVFFLVRSHFISSQIAETYRENATRANRDQEFDQAITYYRRVLRDPGSATPYDHFNFAISLIGTGEHGKGVGIINQLAPEDKKGLGVAHRFKALELVRASQQGQRDINFAERLKFHLSHSEDTTSNEINEAWAVYYFAVSKPESAAEHLQLAVQTNPSHYLTLAGIYRQLSKDEEADQALEMGSQALRKSVAQNPLDNEKRIQLAKILMSQRRFDEAESVLEAGFQLKPDRVISRILADFFVAMFDQRSDLDFARRFDLIHKSLSYDVNHVPAYDRIIKYCVESDSDESKAEVRKYLIQSLAKGNAPALSHFALGNLMWMDGNSEKAQWHIEQAFEINNNLTNVANNLAWVLAHSDRPDLDRALEIATKVVKQSPEDHRFRDTLATILLLRKNYKQAASEFEKILMASSDKSPIHEKLALIYRELGKPEIAAQHELLINAKN